MDYVPALNKARRAFLDTIEPVCTEVDALDMALRHYEEVLAESGYVVAPKEATAGMLQAFYDGEWMTQKPRPDEIWTEMIAARPTDTASATPDGETPHER